MKTFPFLSLLLAFTSAKVEDDVSLFEPNNTLKVNLSERILGGDYTYLDYQVYLTITQNDFAEDPENELPGDFPFPENERPGDVPFPENDFPGDLAYPEYDYGNHIDAFSPFSRLYISCGGSLISYRYVLTAAHCLAGAEKVKVLLGAYSISSHKPHGVEMTSTHFTMHENFGTKQSGTPINDIAIIRLPQSAEPYSKYVRPIKLPSFRESTSKYNGATAVVSGWGNTNYANIHAPSDILKAVGVTVISVQQCCRAWASNPCSADVICTLGEGYDSACKGDSGGPLVSKDRVQIGIVSYGHNMCYSGVPNVFTRVSQYIGWIARNSDLPIK